MKNFSLEYWVDNGWYVGRLKEVPGVFSQGKTLEDLRENIRDYRFLHAAFPHESTSDQFFAEAQFEAYRALGSHVARHLFGDEWRDAECAKELEPFAALSSVAADTRLAPEPAVV